MAKENLGRFAGVLAGSVLALDYVLNVAVAISAGVGALVSAVPELQPHTLTFCLAVLALLVATNLRGIRTAGLVFVTPTYAFVFLVGATIVAGLARTASAGGAPMPVDPAPRLPALSAGVSLWLLAHAFASGCTALTGIEAVSNAVPLFRPPAVRRARLTLTFLVLILGLLVAGVGVLARSYGIGATAPGQPGYESVLSQLVGAVAGRGPWYFATMASVLALSANTSFADFPRVCRLLALDEFLPAGFAHRGGRLVYTLGIVVLALFAGLLLVAFEGVTDRLIPLFAVGAFLAFTLSQAGMLVHWYRQGWRRHWRPLLLNGLGAGATSVTLIVIAVSKFQEGAWLTLVVLPLLIAGFYGIRRYHERVERQTLAEGPLDLADLREPLVVVSVKRLDRVGRKALRCALALSPRVQVVQVLAEELKTEDLAARWAEWIEQPARAAGVTAPRLVRVASEYREFFGPFLAYLRRLSTEEPERTIAVVVPELAERRWYHFLLRHRATLLKGLLVLQGHARIVVISTPYYLRD
ncbi:MAG: APC family permease [Opitutaceae bacterium]